MTDLKVKVLLVLLVIVGLFSSSMSGYAAEEELPVIDKTLSGKLNGAEKPTIQPEDDIMKIAAKAGSVYPEFYRPKGGIVIDSLSGDVLWSENPDKVWPIASLSKLMTAYIVLDEISEGDLTLDSKFKVTDDIQAISQIYSLSNNKMVTGVEYTLRELLTIMLIPSSNAATVMLSDVVSPGKRGEFIDKMNNMAEKLGMTKTKYYNSSGATAASFEGLYNPEGYDPNGDNVSTARDISILIYNFMKHHPEVLEFTKNPKVTVKSGTPYEETFESYVLSVEGNKYSFPGMDGLKTGSSPSAAFGYGATAVRDDKRFIEVLLGVGTWEEQNGEDIRFPIGNALLDKMFKDYDYRKVLSKGENTISGRDVILDDDVYALVKPEQEFSVDFSENGIKIDTGLEGVSDKISAPTVKFKEKTLASNLGFDSDKTITEQFKTNKLIPLLMGLVGIVMIMLSRLVINLRRRKNARGGNLITTVGILLGFALVVVAIYFTLEQLLGGIFN
ncbi:D-alanyl-D-alanine carboxypeptidase [Vagococcus coleopterorum]|uniref:D-alanyl-D-alanine carboxypeptidase n=1 Tax=Vagococcus coleopterorum TaxID=2714946 RepID=A0A6G8AN97_9ENTE|nr:DUF1958 domain-containing protein [Vagococcus coleopterorum]QIL46554.1 D-alanyl-D-alanine carboxypeptidase [Vagococcus coleopterorum]